jgi:peptidoglycan/xylan/chitin deacetylase (PgdA/CDA1 family)
MHLAAPCLTRARSPRRKPQPSRWLGAARAGVVSAVRAADRAVSAAYLSLRAERSALSTFLFHGLFASRAEANAGDADPQQGVTVSDFRGFLEYFLAHGYRFVSVADVLGGLSPGAKYAMVTFDDGYYNNGRALPLLEEYQVPAAVFVSTDHVLEGKCFWWDVLYREARAAGASDGEIAAETGRLKHFRAEEIEAELVARYGPDALRPRCDADRPFTPGELKDFAAHPLVTLGNHTANHAILTRYPPDVIRRQLQGAQDALREMTGVTPLAVAFPNGDYSPAVLDAARSVGLRLGIGVEPRKNRVPLDLKGDGCLRLGRFTPPGGAALLERCRVFRSDVRLYDSLRSLA